MLSDAAALTLVILMAVGVIIAALSQIGAIVTSIISLISGTALTVWLNAENNKHAHWYFVGTFAFITVLYIVHYVWQWILEEFF